MTFTTKTATVTLATALAVTPLAVGGTAASAGTTRTAVEASCAFADNTVRTHRWYRLRNPDWSASRVQAAVTLNEAFAGNAMRCLINAERKKAGLPALQQSYRLFKAADSLVKEAKRLKWWIDDPKDPKNKEWHIHPQTKWEVGQRAKAANYCPTGTWMVGENVYADWDSGATARTAVRWWMNSKEHHDTIMSREFTHVGTSIRQGAARPNITSDHTMVTTQVFGFCR
ncbi:CAP domain-containing protein [Nonomuraea sp. 10N515B]|uniref:CAP domain-containing protein n=1 Tax=Nonomuraea sp. 10N515B TaxID=3457422 RepID=UPI003FCCF239